MANRIEIVLTVDIDGNPSGDELACLANVVRDTLACRLHDGFLPDDVEAADWSVGILSTCADSEVA